MSNLVPNFYGVWSAVIVPMFFLLPWFRVGRGKQQPRKRPARKSLARKHAGLSGYTFSIGLALQHLDGLLLHSAQPMIVQQMEEEDEDDQADDQADLNDPQVLFERQLKRIRRGEQVDRLVLRVR